MLEDKESLAKLNEHREPDYKAVADELLALLKEINSELILPSKIAEKADAAITKHEGVSNG